MLQIDANQFQIYQPVGVTFSLQPSFLILGGSGSYSYASSGLPSGVSMSSTGTISGKVSVAYQGDFTVTVMDLVTNSQITATFDYYFVNTLFNYTNNAPTSSPTLNRRQFSKLTRQILLPPYLETAYFLDLLGVIDFVFDANLDAPVEALENIRNPYWSGPGAEAKIETLDNSTVELQFPAWVSLAASTVISTLPAGTYAYQVAPVFANNTIGPANSLMEVSVGRLISPSLTWTAVPNAVSYNIYGRTEGNLGLLVNVPYSVLSYTDTGATTPVTGGYIPSPYPYPKLLDETDLSSVDRTTLVQQVNLLGIKLQSIGVLDDSSYRSLLRFLGKYWFQKGTKAAIDFLNYALNINLAIDQLYANTTANYLTKIYSVGAVSTFATGLSGPAAMVKDNSGNIYVANYQGGNTISKITPAGIVSTFATVQSPPYALAIDLTTNTLYVGYGPNYPYVLCKITSAGVVTPVFATISTTPCYGQSIVVDSTGSNIYVSNGQGVITRVTSTGSVVTNWAGYSGYTNAPIGIDSSNNVYIATPNTGFTSIVTKITPAGVITTPWATISGINPIGLAIDSSNNVYVACFGAYPISKITSTGVVSTLATLNLPSSFPTPMIVDSFGYIYVGNNTNTTITKIAPNGSYTTFAYLPGYFLWSFILDSSNALYVSNELSFAGNLPSIVKITNSSATATIGTALASTPSAIAIDTSGNYYLANGGSNTVSKVTSAGVVTQVFANTGTNPVAIAVDSSGNVYTANSGSSSITKVTSTGVVTITWATVGTNPVAITVDSSGNVYTANSGSNTVSKVTSAGVVTTTWATAGTNPVAITVDSSGNVYTANKNANSISKVTSAGVVTLNWATTGTSPSGIAIDSSGNVYTANSVSNTVTKVTSAGVVTASWATTGATPSSIAVDSSGNVYTANYGANTLTFITPLGTSTTPYATFTSSVGPLVVDSSGTVYTTEQSIGTDGYWRSGDLTNLLTASQVAANSNYTLLQNVTVPLNTLTPAQLSNVWIPTTLVQITNNTPSISTDTIVTLFDEVCNYNLCINRLYTVQTVVTVLYIDVSGTVLDSIVGTATFPDYAKINIMPLAIAIDSSGNVYTISQSSNSITKVTSAGVVTLNWATVGSVPSDIAVDSSGNVYTANYASNSITKVTSAGVVTLNWATVGSVPGHIAIDSSGNIYKTNYASNSITKVTSAGVVTTSWATTGTSPTAIAVDSIGNVYTANYASNSITKVTSAGVGTTSWATVGSQPVDIAVDNLGNVYTANSVSNTITKVTSAGVVL